MDQLVFIGDLLTYGHDVEEVVELVAEAQIADDAVLLVGNHDQMYLDLAAGDRTYLDGLPDWIRESASRTWEQLNRTAFVEGLRWTDEHEVLGILFAHANPFGARDWTYLNTEHDLARATSAILRREHTAGVFGHTHRPHAGERFSIGEPVTLSRAQPSIINAGTIGQPRGVVGSVLLRLEIGHDVLRATFEHVDYDVAAHVAGLRMMGFNAATLTRLSAFFRT
jgi:predicted phosphodiesterase